MISNSKAIKINEDFKPNWFNRLSYSYYNNYRYSWHGEFYYDKIKYPIIDFFTGIKNFINWYKIIWKDRNYDHSFILEVLSHKLKLQRSAIIKSDSHYGADLDARDIGLCISLIDKVNSDYYALEKYDYQESNFRFEPLLDGSDNSEMIVDTLWEKYDNYLKSYKLSERKVRKLYPDVDFTSKNTLTSYIAQYNQDKANKLLYKILEKKLNGWWY